MCLLARIDNQEFMAFYQGPGKVELRDEHFDSVLLPLKGSVMVKDELEPKPEWREMSASNLMRLAKTRMDEALKGLRLAAL